MWDDIPLRPRSPDGAPAGTVAGAVAGVTTGVGGRREALRLLVASDVRLVREGLAHLLEVAHFAVVSRATAATLREEVQRTAPAVALVDVTSPALLDAVRSLAACHPSVRVVAFGVADGESDVLACAEAGAAGYVSRECGAEEVVAAVESAARAELRCSPRVAAILFRRLAARTPDEAAGPWPRLTRRERDILELIDRGFSNKEIGSQLHIALPTVKHHVHSILKKLHVSRRGQAAARGRGPQRDALR